MDTAPTTTITITSTPHCFEAGGVMTRLWTGTNVATGSPVNALISGIQSAETLPDLIAIPPPQAEWSDTVRAAVEEVWKSASSLSDKQANTLLAAVRQMSRVTERETEAAIAAITADQPVPASPADPDATPATLTALWESYWARVSEDFGQLSDQNRAAAQQLSRFAFYAGASAAMELISRAAPYVELLLEPLLDECLERVSDEVGPA